MTDKSNVFEISIRLQIEDEGRRDEYLARNRTILCNLVTSLLTQGNEYVVPVRVLREAKLPVLPQPGEDLVGDPAKVGLPLAVRRPPRRYRDLATLASPPHYPTTSSGLDATLSLNHPITHILHSSLFLPLNSFMFNSAYIQRNEGLIMTMRVPPRCRSRQKESYRYLLCTLP